MEIKELDNNIKVFISNFELLNTQEISYGKGSPHIKEHQGHFKIKENPKILGKGNCKIETNLLSENILEMTLQVPEEYNRINIKLNTSKSEKIFGGGEQYTHLNLKGKKFPIWVQEQGVGRGYDLISIVTRFKGVSGSWYTTYFPSPIFLSTLGYAIIFETYSPMVVDLKGKSSNFEVWDKTVKLVIIEGDSLKKLSKEVRKYFNTDHTLPDWIHGTLIASQGGTKEIDKKVDLLIKNEVPLTAVWSQDWSGTNITSFGRQVYWNWEYDEKSYPKLPEKIKELNKKGIKFLSYINPFLIAGSSLYNIAKEKDYFVKNSLGEIYKIYVTTFPSGLIDITNKRAYEWYKEIIKNNIINIGTSGWMADFGEYLPVDAVLFSGEDAIKYHNKYPVEWAKLNYEAIKESEKKDLIFFMRSGFLDSVSYCPIYWAGDQNVNWSKSDGIASVIPAALSLGFSGVEFSHWDTGGYTSLLWMKRTPELFMRWVELSAFSLIMRTHEGNRPDNNVQFDTNRGILKHFIWMTNVHYMLKDYLKNEIVKSKLEKLPVMRHICLNYPKDQQCYLQQYEYLLGEDLLIAPILHKGSTERELYLPRDNWIHLWSQKNYEGGEYVRIKSNLGFIPVFIRKESPYLNEILSKIDEVKKKFKIDEKSFKP